MHCCTDTELSQSSVTRSHLSSLLRQQPLRSTDGIRERRCSAPPKLSALCYLQSPQASSKGSPGSIA